MVANPQSGSSSTFTDLIGIWKCCFLGRWEHWCTRRKTSRSKGEKQQQTQPTYAVASRIGTQATMAEDSKCSHHCTTLAPQVLCSLTTCDGLVPHLGGRIMLLVTSRYTNWSHLPPPWTHRP